MEGVPAIAELTSFWGEIKIDNFCKYRESVDKLPLIHGEGGCHGEKFPVTSKGGGVRPEKFPSKKS